MKNRIVFFLAPFMICSVIWISQVSSQTHPPRKDTVLAHRAISPPCIDGQGIDSCWNQAPWYKINYTWIPYGTTVDSNDYSGRFKVVWSSTTNLLYFLVEVTDNVFVDGFIPGVTSDIYNFDIIEVFIDEDKSGGLHVFDATDSIGMQWGTNAENAFAYHMYADFPKDGQVTSKCYVYDLAGTSWSDAKSMNYTSHVPTFALRKSGHKAIWEFSLIVYNNTYEDTMSNKDSARARLYAGKEMGLSLAYCDNDKPDINPKTRDKFFGSVWVPAAAYNDHWMNADYFGIVKLVTPIQAKYSNQH